MNNFSPVKTEKPVETAATEAPLAFRWSYLALPLAVLLLSIVLAAGLYHRLPAQLAYHFGSDGSPDRWLGRGALLLWVLLPELCFTLLAGGITWVMTRLASRFWQPGQNRANLAPILLLMGNMVALPQIVLCFAMLYIFVYNAYQVHLPPLWVFVLIIMVLGGVVLSIFFVQAVRLVWGARR